MMKIVTIGAGYVGLTTAACLAEFGHSVTCVDIDSARIDALRRGILPLYEPGLDELVLKVSAAGCLHFSDQLAMPAKAADVVFIAVGTPSMPNGDIDLSYVEEAARQLAPHLHAQAVVVVKSTVATGTARRLAEIIEPLAGRKVAVASNPEFLREGSAIADFCRPDRIVIGADDARAANVVAALYEPLVRRGVPVVSTSTVSAELTKYSANALLALKIGFINDIADLCEAVGGDVDSVARGVGLDHRIGEAFLSPGPGFGGSCFPKDTRALAAIGRRANAVQPLIEQLITGNEERKIRLAQRVLAALGAPHEGKAVAVLGTAFKANTDDFREAAALTIIPHLQRSGVNIRVHDPKAGGHQIPGSKDITWCATPYQAAEGAHAVVILTEWDEYRELDLSRLAEVMAGSTLLDYRNLLEPAAAETAGLRYIGLGRPALPRRSPGKASEGRPLPANTPRGRTSA
jgi:UDPglucose 6-dehydrogenase